QLLPTKHFSTENILPNNTVRTLLYDDNGTLWIGTDNGLVKKHNNTVTSYFVENGLPLNNIWALSQDEEKNIWIGTYGGGIAYYNKKNFCAISIEDGLSNNEITELKVKGDLLFVGTSNG